MVGPKLGPKYINTEFGKRGMHTDRQTHRQDGVTQIRSTRHATLLDGVEEAHRWVPLYVSQLVISQLPTSHWRPRKSLCSQSTQLDPASARGTAKKTDRQTGRRRHGVRTVPSSPSCRLGLLCLGFGPQERVERRRERSPGVVGQSRAWRGPSRLGPKP